MSYMLVFVTVFSVAFFAYIQPVQATEVIVPIVKNAFYAALTRFGGNVIADEQVFDDFVGTFKEQLEAIIPRKNDDGTMTFSEEQLKQLQQLFDQYLSETPEALDVTWMPVVSSDDVPADWFQSTTSYYQFRSQTDDKGYSYVYYNQASVFVDGKGVLRNLWLYADLSDCCIMSSNSGTFVTAVNQLNMWSNAWGNKLSSTSILRDISIRMSDGVYQPVPVYAAYGYDDGVKYELAQEQNVGGLRLHYPFSPVTLSGVTAYQGTGLYVRGCNTDAASFVPVFRDTASFMRWITGQGSYYRFDSGYKGGDITIDPDADYSVITDAIADAMKQASENGANMATMLAKMQAAFAKKLGEISGTLDDIGNNTAQTNTLLEEILALLQQQEKELQDYFGSAGSSLDDLKDLLTASDGKEEKGIASLFVEFVIIWRTQKQDMEQYFEDARQFFKMQPIKIGIFIESAVKDIVDAVKEVRDAVLGIRINIDYGDVDGGGSDGESMWKMLGEGIGKILTAVLDLLKVLIFRGLDALAYLVDVMIDNIGTVFDGIGVYFDAFIEYIEMNTVFFLIRESLPDEIQTIWVLFFFSIAVSGIIRYVKRG